jgi:hypothetical protein
MRVRSLFLLLAQPELERLYQVVSLERSAFLLIRRSQILVASLLVLPMYCLS